MDWIKGGLFGLLAALAIVLPGVVLGHHTDEDFGCIYTGNEGPGDGEAAIHWHGTTGWTYLGADASHDDYRRQFAAVCEIDGRWFWDNADWGDVDPYWKELNEGERTPASTGI